jgi:hypothetical protein
LATPSDNPFAHFEAAFSLERFSRYLGWAANDRVRAVNLYTLNTQVSESLYTPLQMLEVALRNRIHAVMSELHGEDWVRNVALLLGDHQPAQIENAIRDIQADRKEPTPSRIVAALTLGFWTAMFGRLYEDRWQQGLHRIAKRTDGRGLRRKDFSEPLGRIRKLRNRIAHHEPVIYSDLHKTHAQILTLIQWLSPPASDWCAAHSRFPDVCPADLHIAIKQASRR